MRRLLLQLLLLLFVLPSFGQIFQQKVTGETAGTNGRRPADDLGYSVSISEDVMVVGAPRQKYNNVGLDSLFYAGAAYVYHKVGGEWQFVKKLSGDLSGTNGRVAEDFFGCSVSVSGDVVVVGAYYQDYDSIGGDYKYEAGAAYIFRRNEGGQNNWGLIKKVTGASAGSNGRMQADCFGFSVSVSEEIMAIGTLRQDYDSAGVYGGGSGAVYLFYRNKGGQDNWGFMKKLTGASAGYNGVGIADQFGYSVCVSKDILVVGADFHSYDSSGGNYKQGAGAAYVFYRNAGGVDNWGFVKKLTGASAGYNGRADMDNFGCSVSITDDIIISGARAHRYDSVGGSKYRNAGAVYIYERNKGGQDNWGFVKKLTGASAGKYGRDSENLLGNSVALSGDILIAAAVGHSYDSIGENTRYWSGAVYIYERNKGGQNNWGFVKKLTGSSAGNNGRKGGDKFGYSVSAYKGEILIGAKEQDYNSLGSSFVDGAGAAYIFAAYFQKTISISTCKNYISSQGKIYTTSGTYTDTFTNTSGIDSIITIHLTINQHSASAISATVCSSYASPQGKIYTVSGTYYDTLTNSIGCDSIITINLTIFQQTIDTINSISCGSYTSPKGKTYTTSGTYIDTLVNAQGCDSILVYNFIVNQATTSSFSPIECNVFTSPSGKTYTSSGTYYDTLTNAMGCDSIITINLIIYNVDKTVTQVGAQLIANDTNATSFQWLDCNNSFSVISGQTNKVFTATANGSYAVAISTGNCADTSNCFTVIGLGINNISNQNIALYPNPTSDIVTIMFAQPVVNAYIRIVSINGQTISEKRNVVGAQEKLDLTKMPIGVYFIEVIENDKISRLKIIKI